ncbi:MAG TPA: ParA family protein [Candidatus Fimihabitans intestinipullorum]|uniref:ParA family protein n=1 Tax=Candidatus Fimihabitans intestinipullorum TaxID=2840820 RepID=A0A9D1HUT6_9BACT|nr:ParA family protein [Candidatus Fimihabitans intestinipullorum]
MGKIIALVNQKGGVGKTTSSINLAASLGALGKKVLLVDLDPQGNATTGIGINKADIRLSVYDLLIDKAVLKDVILKTPFKNLYAMPATINLAGVDIELIEKSQLEPGFVKGQQLKKHLDGAKNVFDYIIIDCPPSLGILTTNALTASDSVIIPVQCEFFALEGIMQLLNTIMLAQKNLNPTLDIEGVLLTMLDSRTNLGLEVVEDIKSYFKERVYDTIIPRLVKLSEAPSHGKPILAYDSTSRGTEAYLNLAKEVIERNGK